MPKQAFTPTWTYQYKFSDVVLGYVMGSDIGHAFREVTLTKTDTLQLGSVIATDGTEAANAGAADTIFVWTDEAAFGFENIPVGQEFKAVVAKRDVTLDRDKVFYSNGNAIDDAGVAALDEKGLKLTDKVLKPFIRTT
jgi:hypothetical protein